MQTQSTPPVPAHVTIIPMPERQAIRLTFRLKGAFAAYFQAGSRVRSYAEVLAQDTATSQRYDIISPRNPDPVIQLETARQSLSDQTQLFQDVLFALDYAPEVIEALVASARWWAVKDLSPRFRTPDMDDAAVEVICEGGER